MESGLWKNKLSFLRGFLVFLAEMSEDLPEQDQYPIRRCFGSQIKQSGEDYGETTFFHAQSYRCPERDGSG